MIAGIIGGSVAVVAIAIIIASLAFALRDAERRTADARVDATNKAGQLAIAAADVATWKNTAADESRRANALDDILDEVATSGDAAGARSRVLSRWAREAGDGADTAHRDGASAVPTPSATKTAVGGDDLVRPGQ